MNFAALAIEFGVDASALEGLINFLMTNINRTPENRAAFESNPDFYLRQGVEAWRDQSRAFHEELLAGETDRAIYWRNEIERQVIEIARNGQ